MKKHYINIISLLVFFSLAAACNLFNLSVPEYIDTYTNTAAVGKYDFTQPVVDTIGNITFIQENSEILLSLRNPKRYVLVPSLEYSTEPGVWKNFASELPGSGNITFMDPQLPGTITAEYEEPDKVRISLTGAAVGKEYKLRLTLEDKESRRTFESYVLPNLTCFYKPGEVQNLLVAPGTGNMGLTILWEQSLRNDICDADTLVISGNGFASETYTRKFNGTSWGQWKTEDGSKSINFSAPLYKASFANTVPVNPLTNYGIKLHFSNTNLKREESGTCFTGNGAVRVDIKNGGGAIIDTLQCFTLQTALAYITDNQIADITVLENITSNPLATISAGAGSTKTITIRPSGNRTISLSGNGSLFTVDSGGTLILEGSGNNTLTLKGHTGNTRALISSVGGTLEMHNGVKITGNSQNYNGGGVHVSGNFAMKGGNISGNSADSGGGVFIEGGTFTMEGGIIGGSSSLEKNSAAIGGGVSVALGIFEMKGDAKISYNTVTGNGGGVAIIVDGTFKMSGNAEISNNSATGTNARGSGVLFDEGEFSISGGARVNTNNDIFQASTITIAVGTFTGTDTIGRITPETYTDGISVLGGEAEVLSGAYSRFTVAPAGSIYWAINESGLLKQTTVAMRVGTGSSTYYLTPGEAIKAVQAGQTATVTLLADVNQGICTIDSNKHITLETNNGSRTVNLTGTGSLFTITSGSTLIVKGTGSNALTLKGVPANSAALLKVNSGGTLEIKDGAIITGNNRNGGANDEGGGIYSEGTVRMTGGLIGKTATSVQNKAGYGGGIYIAAGSLTMSGGTIGGDEIDSNYAIIQGGGIYVRSTGTLTISGTAVIKGNKADNRGGGIYNDNNGTNSTINNCTFLKNIAGLSGGAINSYSSNLMITNCTFLNNSANSGGAVYNSISSPTIINCIFSNNIAVSNNGGAIYNYETSNPAITNCTFSSNSANTRGGAISNWYSSSPTITNCTFSENISNDIGGAIENYSSNPMVINCTFSNNSAKNGGAVYNWSDSSPTIINSTFSGNTASSSGGAINNVTYCSSNLFGSILVGNSAISYPSTNEVGGSGSLLATSKDNLIAGTGTMFNAYGITFTGQLNEIFANVPEGKAVLTQPQAGWPNKVPVLMINQNPNTRITLPVSGWTVPTHDQRGYRRPASGSTYKGSVDPTATAP